MIARRSFIAGLAGLLATPVIVRGGSLMPVKRLVPIDWRWGGVQHIDLRMTQENAFLEQMSQQIAAVLWYGNGDYRPIRFDEFYCMNALPA